MNTHNAQYVCLLMTLDRQYHCYFVIILFILAASKNGFLAQKIAPFVGKISDAMINIRKWKAMKQYKRNKK